MERPDPSLSAGTVVGGYRIERQLGAGGMGAVYAAEEPTIKKRVAIKVMRRMFAEDPTMAARFEREARAANDIRHPGIVDVFAFGRLADGRPYLVMSLLEGQSLRDAIAARGQMPASEAWAIARPIADALVAAHEAGIVHRDLKPDNVFLERHGTRAPTPRILDFGIAKIAQDEGSTGKLTQTGVPIGTPAYMAPEQWWGQPVDARADQYAFGVMLFEMLAGRPPFTATQFMELAQAHTQTPPPTLASLGVAVAPAVEALVSRALAKASEDRFPSLQALVDAADAAFAAVPPPEDSEASVSADISAFAATMAHPSGAATPIALARPDARSGLRRYIAFHAAVLVVGLLAFVGIGYAGENRRDVVEWFTQSGWPAWLVAASLLAGVFGLPIVALRRASTGSTGRFAPWLVLGAATFGGWGTYAGWMAVAAHIGPHCRPVMRFACINQGAYEANTLRFAGFAISAFFAVSLAALPVFVPAASLDNATSTSASRRRETAGFALGLVALAVVALVLGAPSGALLAGVGAVVVGLELVPRPAPSDATLRDHVERAVWGGLAMVLLAASSWSRVAGREYVLWAQQPNRAARVTEIVAALAEQRATLAVLVAVLVSVAAITVLRVRRVLTATTARPPRTTWALVGVLVAALGTDLVLQASYVGRRDRIREEMAGQFSLFARLDPPPAGTLDALEHRPHKAPALQIARTAVAVNGVGVAPLAALEGADGAADVKRALNAARATAMADERDASTPDLALYVDRDVPWPVVRTLLAAVQPTGVRKIEILLTRGGAFDPPADAPPEAAYVLPMDFVALPVSLEEGGLELAPSARFGDVTPTLVDAYQRSGKVALAVD